MRHVPARSLRAVGGLRQSSGLSDAKPGDPPPAQDMLLWNARATAVRPFFQYLSPPKPDMTGGLNQLGAQLHDTLTAEPGIQLVDEAMANTWFTRRSGRA